MRFTISAVGRLKAGSEQVLIAEYSKRITATGRALALGPLEILEVDERKAREREAQSARLLERLPSGACVVALDERGKLMSSPDFANLIQRTRDGGADEMTFLIGGADGHTKAVRERADHMLSFGQMVWPHMLARVMLSEQLYRAVSILSGSPYHRS